MQVSLREGNHNIGLLEEPVDGHSHFCFNLLALHDSSRVDPKMHLKSKSVVSEVVEPDERLRPIMYRFIFICGSLQQLDDRFQRRTIRDTNVDRGSQAIVATS